HAQRGELNRLAVYILVERRAARVDQADRDGLVEAFLEAARGGDMARLVAVLTSPAAYVSSRTSTGWPWWCTATRGCPRARCRRRSPGRGRRCSRRSGTGCRSPSA